MAAKRTPHEGGLGMRLDIRAQNVALTAPLLARVETRDHHRRAPARFSRAAGSDARPARRLPSARRKARRGLRARKQRPIAAAAMPLGHRQTRRADQQGV